MEQLEGKQEELELERVEKVRKNTEMVTKELELVRQTESCFTQCKFVVYIIFNFLRPSEPVQYRN